MCSYYVLTATGNKVTDDHGFALTVSQAVKDAAEAIPLPYTYVPVDDGYSYWRELTTYKGGRNYGD